jgi:hypothetical protein
MRRSPDPPIRSVPVTQCVIATLLALQLVLVSSLGDSEAGGGQGLHLRGRAVQACEGSLSLYVDPSQAFMVSAALLVELYTDNQILSFVTDAQPFIANNVQTIPLSNLPCDLNIVGVNLSTAEGTSTISIMQLTLCYGDVLGGCRPSETYRNYEQLQVVPTGTYFALEPPM